MKLISQTYLLPIQDDIEPRFCGWRDGTMRCTRFARIHYITDEDAKSLCYDHAQEYERLYLGDQLEP